MTDDYYFQICITSPNEIFFFIFAAIIDPTVSYIQKLYFIGIIFRLRF
jgi:hypothetical protein